MAEIKVQVPPKITPPAKKVEVAKANLTPLEKREDAVNGLFQIAGLGMIMAGQFADAGAISLHSPAVSHEVAVLAEDNSQIAGYIDRLLQVGPYAALVTAIAPLALQLVVNHGIIKPEKVSGQGIVPPDILESQVKTEMARMQMEAIRQQQEAEKELAAMRAEYERQMAEENDAA